MTNEDLIKKAAFKKFPFVEDKRASNGELYQSDSYRLERKLFIEAATFGASLQTSNGWVGVDIDSIPKTEVLAINGEKDYLIGYLYVLQMSGDVTCESDDSYLYRVTHYQLLTQPNE